MERVTRRSFLKATAGVVAAVTLPGCSDGGHTDQHIPTPQNTVFESAPSTSSPVNTTLVEKTTLPSTSSSTTTTEAPTTTAEPQPTDVVEHRDGYDVLRNGFFQYPIETITVNGAEVDIHGSGGVGLAIQGEKASRYEFKQGDGEQPSAQEVVYTDLLTTFANQKGMTLEDYVAYLKDNNWVDAGALFPDNVSEPGAHAKYPPVSKVPVTIDFKQPFILSNLDLSTVEGLDPFSGTFDYYYPTLADNARSLLAVSEQGQLMYDYHGLNLTTEKITGILQDESLSAYTNNIGYMLSIISGLGYEAVDSQMQWIQVSMAYAVPVGKIDPSTIQDYETVKNFVLPMEHYVEPQVGGSKLFQKSTS